MKKIFYLPILIVLFLSCSNNTENNPTEPTIIGKWKQIELYNSNGGVSPSWHPISYGYTIEFLSNGTFKATKFAECSSGIYTVSTTNEITMTYNCSSFTNIYIEKVEVNTTTQLILKPTYLTCDEGCSVKFEKIN